MKQEELKKWKKTFISNEIKNLSGQDESIILNEIMSLSIKAGLQHSKTYIKGTTDKKKKPLQDYLRTFLKSTTWEKLYTINTIEEKEKQLEAWIEMLSNTLSKDYGVILRNSEFRIGISQKIINLFIKYIWTLGWFKDTPPHCPFDSIIIAKLDKGRKDKLPCWTKINCIEIYKDYVKAANEYEKDELSIAEWELKIWNDWNEKNKIK